MTETPITRKLGIKSGFSLLVLHAPDGMIESLGLLPDDVTVSTQPEGLYALVLAFFKNRSEVEQFGPEALNAVKPGGLLWLCYPKQSSTLKSDIHRDTGWDVIREAGWEGVSLISIDDTWSAMRFRPTHEIKSRARDS